MTTMQATTSTTAASLGVLGLWLGGLGALVAVPASAQPRPADARSAAPIDLEGYWVSVVTEDWRWRMVTPAKGDYASVPLNGEGIRVANEWEPGGGEGSCLPYGAPNVMRMPTRVRIEWAGSDTLRLETDHGMQTRELRFGAADEAPEPPSRQGVSAASWDGSALKVETTGLLPGWLRRNGVPYSASAEVTEYFNTHSAYGDDGFTVTTIVRDPVYLAQDFVTSTTFKKLPDGSDWNPTPCSEPDRDAAAR
jgi:hypothetical protein